VFKNPLTHLIKLFQNGVQKWVVSFIFLSLRQKNSKVLSSKRRNLCIDRSTVLNTISATKLHEYDPAKIKIVITRPNVDAPCSLIRQLGHVGFLDFCSCNVSCN